MNFLKFDILLGIGKIPYSFVHVLTRLACMEYGSHLLNKTSEQ